MFELPIRSKIKMGKEVVQIIADLHLGKREELEALIKDLKLRAIVLGDEIQQEVLKFAAQVFFQYDYDPWHRITPEVTQAADRLMEVLGFYTQRTSKVGF